MRCRANDRHVFGFDDDGDYRCLICGDPIQHDCDAEPYDPELEARIDDALERGEP